MKTEIVVLPEENALGEDEGNESFCPNFSGELFVVHVETSEVIMLEGGPVAA